MYVKAKDGSWETPLVEGKECAFALFEENGVVKCSIEKAFNEKKISWQKPISCHLYPVRLNKIGDLIVQENEDQIKTNYKSICLQKEIYSFLKPLILK